MYVMYPLFLAIAWDRMAFVLAMSLYSSESVLYPDSQTASRFAGSAPPS